MKLSFLALGLFLTSSVFALPGDIKLKCTRGAAVGQFLDRLKDPTIDFTINEREIRFTSYTKDKYGRDKNYVSGLFLGTNNKDLLAYDGATLVAYMWDVSTSPQIFVEPQIFEGKVGSISFQGYDGRFKFTRIDYLCPGK